ncbi:SWIB complex BAF60b domain-containing family protein [Hibiscus syriacus]|uniref:SWIB complex BAF60b domain-containing family protein n=1 Tax=Hibiscus syriacus TaxID=106335 RepID=A0A6A2YTI3_HIBSY|nr:uncharacterized protein LOC120157408 [Hibiscus syriacus]KAE8682342.1 SWIB complex BAF60b domain-containing family protein [Hibiscus syriacus]
MASSSSSIKTNSMKKPRALVGAASWYYTVALLTLIFIGSTRANYEAADVKGRQLLNRPCDEFYVVREGETLNMIGDKCDDPFIVERNPHINDPDDVFPGLVIHIVSSNASKL